MVKAFDKELTSSKPLTCGRPQSSAKVGYKQITDARVGLERYADTIAQAKRINLPKKAKGYCTWYSKPHGGDGDKREHADWVNAGFRDD